LKNITTQDCYYELGESENKINDKAIKKMFAELWDSIYGQTEYKYKNNPYVWVYEFELYKAREIK